MANGKMNEWLRLWHRLLDDPSIEPFKEPGDMAGVLADWRHDPERLAKAFEPLPHGDEILSRLKRCIGTEAKEDSAHRAYLVPAAMEASDNELRQLVVDALDRGSRCCGIEVPEHPVHIILRRITGEDLRNADYLVEGLDDFVMCSSIVPDSPEDEAVRFLSETLYALASNDVVKWYCLTPVYPEEVREIDPYEPQFELWKRGADAVVRWADDSEDVWVDVFVNCENGSGINDDQPGGSARFGGKQRPWWKIW